MGNSPVPVRWLLKELPKWEESGWVTADGARKLREHYHLQENRDTLQNRIILILSLLGAALVGGGVILLFAYNWEAFSRLQRTVLSLLPLAIAQAVAFFSLLRKAPCSAWREGSAVGVMAAVGASIALIGQTYNIPGSVSGFAFTWIWLSIPTVWVLQAPNAALLVIGQLFLWMLNTQDHGLLAWMAWAILVPVAGFAGWIQKQHVKEFALLNLGLLLYASITLLLTPESHLWQGWILFLVPWLVILHELGQRRFATRTGRAAAIIARAVFIFLLVAGTYEAFWSTSVAPVLRSAWQHWPDILLVILLNGLAIWLAMKDWGKRGWPGRWICAAPLLAVFGWIFGAYLQHAVLTAVVMNVVAVAFGLALVLPGWKSGKLGHVQLGAGFLCLLLILRFFDYDFSLLTRGIVFIVAGSAFLGLNYRLSQMRRRGNL